MIVSTPKFRLVLVPALAILCGLFPGASPAHASPGQPMDTVKLFGAGPFILLLAVAFLSMLGLTAAAFGQIDRVAGFAARAAERLERGRLIPTLWGICFSVLVFIVCAMLMSHKPVALLGILAALAGAALLGLGVAVAAVRVGRDIMVALGRLGDDDLTALQLGLTVLFTVSVPPFLGWILVLLAAASGIGALLDTWLARQQQ